MKPATQLDGLEIKLRQLAAKMERQRVQHEATQAENENLKRELDRQLGVVNSLKDKLAQTQQPIAAGKAPAENNDEQREAIQFCLREIDRCLDWLHRN
ncbi:hypothetical protein [Neolewinella litorea]|uniref:Uncharacterized protein n=1 Tax=Neolewinella litorea TaxID=2562452 RepID=A0A4S4NDA9_9BACT|nr:hypothetical protein [Neolewinella litorea]THH36517.1 hypothetical protein E4021_14720 [Neolewinella litorea]